MDEVAGFYGTLIVIGLFLLTAMLLDTKGRRNRK